MAAKKKNETAARPAAQDLRSMSVEELRTALAEQRQELMSARFKHAAAQLGSDLPADFMCHQADRARSRIGRHCLEALAEPDHGHRHVRQALQPFAQRRHGRAEHDQIGLGHMRAHIAAHHGQGCGELHALQVARVGALGLHLLRLRGIARPECDRMAVGRVARSAHGDRRAPGPGSDDENLHDGKNNKSSVAPR